MDVVAFTPEGVVQSRVGNSLGISTRIWSFKVEHEGDVFEVDRSVGIDESDGNRLFEACENGFVVAVTDPFQSSEDGCGILACLEGCIIEVETRARIEVVEDTFIIGLSVKDWISSLISTRPIIRNSPHVRVSRVIDVGHEPLALAFTHVGNTLACILMVVSDSIAIEVVVSFNPIHECQFHRNSNLIMDEDSNILLVDACLIRSICREHRTTLGRCCINTERAAPIGIRCHDVRWISLIVGLNLVIQTIWNIDVWCDHANEERTIDVGCITGS